MENSKIDNLAIETLQMIIVESKRLAEEAAREVCLRDGDWNTCGFAWVEIHGIKGNTRLGRMLKKVGVEQGKRAFHIWNPGGLPVQSVEIKEAGAVACCKYLRSKGFTAYACSRLD